MSRFGKRSLSLASGPQRSGRYPSRLSTVLPSRWESENLPFGTLPPGTRGRPRMEFQGTERYYLDPELGAIVNMALVMEKPLLLTGEAGTGKTQLGFEVAQALGMPIEVLRCKSTIKGEEACYVQDTVLRLNDARFGTVETGRDVNNFFDYVIWGPIGRAFRSEEREVLLLDEIDKTESDVQDNLLDVLEDCQFTIREV